ncbi:V-type proton ATPase subunit S1-like [Rhincodon typus]|uniref:V-type proton ATPase subunit S1-like n=1 Tax=Rhincodon typus TaxID=259920 RepID=UPI00202E93AA|nr:V-type proton ATPase subunit S1-like [Rhincodon typus]
MAAVGRFLAAVTLAAALSPGTGTDQVPVLAWSTESSLWAPDAAPPVGRILTAEQLSSYLKPALDRGPKTVLLFLQDKLSVEDFTVYGAPYGNKQENAFSNLQKALETSPSSLVLPAVDWHATSSLLSSLQQQTGKRPLYVHQLTIHELRLNASVPSLLVVHLPYTSSSIMMPAKEALTGNDNIIGEVLQTLKSEGVPFLAILTASRPSKITQDGPMMVLGPSRQLLASRDEGESEARGSYPPLAYNQTEDKACILFWAAGIHISKGGTPVDLTNRTFGPGAIVDVGSSTCENETATLVLEYDNIEKLGRVRIVFKMSNRLYKVSGKWWFTLDQVEVYLDNDRASFNVTQVYAPAMYSYHCKRVAQDEVASSILPWSSSTRLWDVIFDDFQIQGFGVKGMHFSYASDCAGFFTPAIWMGLLTTLLMVFILTYGLHMITNLKTMDHFDDPKGPSISVPQTE